MAQVQVTEDELQQEIEDILKTHRYILPFEVPEMTSRIMRVIRKFVCSQSMQKPF